MNTIKEFLSLEEFESIIFNNNKIVLDRVNESFDFLKEFSVNKIIYGVNTGFGPMAQYRVKDEDRIQLQYNLIRSHASGTGKPLNATCVKAAILARLNTLSLGNSGVHSSVIQLMKELINRDITPLIFEHGGVGASGDLVQLAHLALVLIGEGEVFYKGERRLTQEVFAIEKLEPIQVEIREGLALMNGTSVMTGIGVVNVHHANKLLDWSIKFSGAINEKVQAYYSLRCVPQILGPVLETINNVASILEEEFNSANDNPIIDVKNQHVYHGGNFHGDYISLEMDKLKIVVTKLTMLAERQLNYLLNSKINEILPPFVNMGTLGFNFGMQGVQFTATSTTAENQMLSNPMYVHSIPNNNDNQDIVSMGTNAAVITSKVIENAFEVLAIELITIVQAIDYLEQKDQISSVTRKIYDDIRIIIPRFEKDQVMYPFVQ